MDEDKEEKTNEEQRRKRRRKSKTSQTDDETSNCNCQNMDETLQEIKQKLDLASTEEIKQKLDLALSKFAEIDEFKRKIKDLEEEKDSLQESLKNAHEEIDDLKEQSKAQGKAIGELKKGVKDLTRNANSEKERAIKLESHSRRNNLNFFNIPEESKEDSFAKTEFLKKELKAEDTEEISI